MRTMTKHEVTIPLDDLYGGGADTEEHQALLARNYGVTIVRDHCDRPAVSLADAYKIRDARKAAEADLAAELVQRRNDEAILSAWAKARADFWEFHYVATLRDQPLGVMSESDRGSKARLALAQRILDLEAEAGIPHDIQARLTWPSWNSVYRYPSNDDRPGDGAYVPPTQEAR